MINIAHRWYWENPSRKTRTCIKFLILLAALAYPIAFGHWRYSTTYGPPKLFDFLDGVIVALPLSVGLVLSATRFGRGRKILTLAMLLPSAAIHFVFQIYTFPFLVFYMLLADCLGAYLVLTEEIRR